MGADALQSAVSQAVPGQTAVQPEGAFLNAVNWLCNVNRPFCVNRRECIDSDRVTSGSGSGIASSVYRNDSRRSEAIARLKHKDLIALKWPGRPRQNAPAHR